MIRVNKFIIIILLFGLSTPVLAVNPMYLYIDGPIYSTRVSEQGYRVPGTLEQFRAQFYSTYNATTTPEAVRTIIIIINSGGGEVYEAMAVYDYIQQLRKCYKVVTVATGGCASAATIILQAGDRRYITNHTYYMTHSPLVMSPGERTTGTDAKELVKGLDRCNTAIMEIFAMRMNRPIKSILRYFTDTPFELTGLNGALEAQRLGFVDGVIMDKAWQYPWLDQYDK